MELTIKKQIIEAEEPDGVLYKIFVEGEKDLFTWQKFDKLPATVTGEITVSPSGKRIFKLEEKQQEQGKEENKAAVTVKESAPPPATIEPISDKEVSSILVKGGDFKNIASLIDSAERLTAVAKRISESDLVPKEFKNNPGSVMLAIEIAQRLDVPIVAIFQNLYVVYGRMSWAGKFNMARLKQSGRYKSLEYEKDAQNGGRTRLVGVTKEGVKREGAWVSMELAKAEGWYEKNGSKWKTMPDQMQMYRAASFFINAFDPDLNMGLPDEYEARDIHDIEFEEVKSESAKEGREAANNLK